MDTADLPRTVSTLSNRETARRLYDPPSKAARKQSTSEALAIGPGFLNKGLDLRLRSCLAPRSQILIG